MFTFTKFDQKVFAKKQDSLGLQILMVIRSAGRLRANENGHIEIFDVEKLEWVEKLPKSLESGYMRVCLFDGIAVYEHDAVFVAAYGYIPGEIDHIDTHKDNNKIENIRETSHTDNIRRREAAEGRQSIRPAKGMDRAVAVLWITGLGLPRRRRGN